MYSCAHLCVGAYGHQTHVDAAGETSGVFIALYLVALRQGLSLNRNLTSPVKLAVWQMSSCHCPVSGPCPTSSVGDIRNYTQISAWKLGVYIQILMFVQQAFFPTHAPPQPLGTCSSVVLSCSTGNRTWTLSDARQVLHTELYPQPWCRGSVFCCLLLVRQGLTI